jgi:hypothetical protein
MLSSSISHVIPSSVLRNQRPFTMVNPPLNAILDSDSSEQLVMKVVDRYSERDQAFQLVHKVYCRAGLTEANHVGRRVMRQHLLDTTDVLIAKLNNQVHFTVSLVGDGDFGLPMESLFADEVEAMRSQGIRMAEVSCLASTIDPENKRLRFDTLVKMISLLIQAARARGIDRLMLAVHPKHAKVYERLFGCVRCSDVKEYAAVRGNPAVLCIHDFADLDIKRYPLYDQIYGPEYEPWQIDGAPMSEAEKTYFESFLPAGEYEVVPMAA